MIKLFVFIIIFSCSSFGETYIVRKQIKENSQSLLSVRVQGKEVQKRKLIKKIRESINEKVKTHNTFYTEELVPKSQLSGAELELLKSEKKLSINQYEVRSLIKQGPDNNRIVLTFLGDGYTDSEREKFFNDTQYLVDELFQGNTFKSYIKLFNVYAVFTPSIDSGISDLKNKRTIFELYRSPRGSKRGIMPGNKSNIENVLNGLDFVTDYPVIIANDQYYGGLGGQYAITTASRNSGAMVLRHELGHNFSNVGEEYDGGQVYSGANFSSNKNLKWQHWIEGPVNFFHAINIKNSYVWKNLKDDSYQLNFDVPSNYLFESKISMIGIESENEVQVTLDDKKLEVTGIYTKDRSFYNSEIMSLSEESHTLEIKNLKGDDNELAYVKSYAYPPGYDFTDGLIGGFNVFDESGREVGYRPTHNKCLMRDMREDIFCPIDQESIWIQFFARINGIDSIVIDELSVSLELLSVGSFGIKWFKKGSWGKVQEIPELRNKKTALRSNLGEGKFFIEVEFSHPEIKQKHKNLTSTREFKL